MKRSIRNCAAALALLVSMTVGAYDARGGVITLVSAGEVEQLLTRLGAPDPNVRASAACQLGQLGRAADASIPALVRLLGDDAFVTDLDCGKNDRKWSDPESTVGKHAAIALAQINGPAVEALVGALEGSSVVVRTNAAFGLGLTGTARVSAPLAGALHDPAWQVRERAAWALGLQGDESAVEPLVGALGDPEARVRAQAAWALGLKGDERAVEPLVAALEDPSSKVRSQVAWALGLKGDERAVEALIRHLSDESAEVQSQAAWALGLKGDRRALDPLMQAMESPEASVRKQAAWALGMISMRDGKPGPRIDADPRPSISTRDGGSDE